MKRWVLVAGLGELAACRSRPCLTSWNDQAPSLSRPTRGSDALVGARWCERRRAKRLGGQLADRRVGDRLRGGADRSAGACPRRTCGRQRDQHARRRAAADRAVELDRTVGPAAGAGTVRTAAAAATGCHRRRRCRTPSANFAAAGAAAVRSRPSRSRRRPCRRAGGLTIRVCCPAGLVARLADLVGELRDEDQRERDPQARR